MKRISDAHGGLLRPDDVVEEARDPANPLYSRFEWDDSKAAHLYRLDTARHLIASVRFYFRDGTQSLKVPLYVHTEHKEQGYRAVTSIRNDAEISRAAMMEEFLRAETALERAEGLAAYFGLEGDVQKVRARVEKLRAKGLSAPAVS